MLSKRSRYLLADVACGPGLAPPQRGQLGNVGFLGLAPGGFSLEPIQTSMANLYGARCQDVRKLDSSKSSRSQST
ncbi:unnamed protein product [Absidia cylindrospora]